MPPSNTRDHNIQPPLAPARPHHQTWNADADLCKRLADILRWSDGAMGKSFVEQQARALFGRRARGQVERKAGELVAPPLAVYGGDTYTPCAWQSIAQVHADNAPGRVLHHGYSGECERLD